MKHGAPDLLALMLASPRLTVAAAESLTCGRVQAGLGKISGSSAFFLGGITAYTLEGKVRHLGVRRSAARQVNSVSAAVAEQMAVGVCALFGSDLGLATTGYAEASPDQGVAQPFAWWALAHVHRGRRVALRSGRVVCQGASRVSAQRKVASAVLRKLVAYLRELRE